MRRVQSIATLDLVAEHNILPLQMAMLQGAFHHQANFVDLEGLRQIVVGTCLHGGQGGFGGGVSRDYDYLGIRREFLGAGQYIEARTIRHSQVC